MIDNYLKNQYTKAIKRHPSYVYKDICLCSRFHPAKDTFGIITVIRSEKAALKMMKMWRNYNA